MTDEDLENLLGIVRRMDPRKTISIGRFTCHASELLVVIEDALQARAWAAAAQTETV